MSNNISILSDNIVKSTSINKLIYIELRKYTSIRYVSYRDNATIKNTDVDYINSIFMLYKYFLKRKNSVCIYGLTEGVKDWIKLFILSITGVKIIRITNISTMNQKSNSRLSLVKKITNRVLFLTYLALIKTHLLPKVTIYFTSKHNNSYYDRIKYKRIYKINTIHCDEINSYNFDKTDDFIVFIDSNIPYHSDQLRECSNTVDPVTYYKQVNDFLDLCVKKYNKKAVLCMHPSFDMSQKEDYFGNKLVTQYETFNYISKAFLVVFHCSAAINYAIIMKKNIIQANSKVFNSFWKGLINAYQEKIDCQQIMLEDRSLQEYHPYSADGFIDSELCNYNKFYFGDYKRNSIIKC